MQPSDDAAGRRRLVIYRLPDGSSFAEQGDPERAAEVGAVLTALGRYVVVAVDVTREPPVVVLGRHG